MKGPKQHKGSSSGCRRVGSGGGGQYRSSGGGSSSIQKRLAFAMESIVWKKKSSVSN